MLTILGKVKYKRCYRKGVGEKIMSKAEGNLSGEGLNIGAEWAKTYTIGK